MFLFLIVDPKDAIHDPRRIVNAQNYFVSVRTYVHNSAGYDDFVDEPVIPQNEKVLHVHGLNLLNFDLLGIVSCVVINVDPMWTINILAIPVVKNLIIDLNDEDSKVCVPQA